MREKSINKLSAANAALEKTKCELSSKVTEVQMMLEEAMRQNNQIKSNATLFHDKYKHYKAQLEVSMKEKEQVCVSYHMDSI